MREVLAEVDERTSEDTWELTIHSRRLDGDITGYT
jgi:hypothetical protein